MENCVILSTLNLLFELDFVSIGGEFIGKSVDMIGKSGREEDNLKIRFTRKLAEQKMNNSIFGKGIAHFLTREVWSPNPLHLFRSVNSATILHSQRRCPLPSQPSTQISKSLLQSKLALGLQLWTGKMS